MPEGRKLGTAPQAFTCRMEALLATPITDEDTASAATLAGQAFKVKAGRPQVLNLLVSTFENAVAKNQELVVAN